MAKINVGDQLINESGTCVTVVEDPEDMALEPGTIPVSLVDDFTEAGYRKVTKSDEVPLQFHELGNLEDERARQAAGLAGRFYVKE
jgi:hypothetical protein